MNFAHLQLLDSALPVGAFSHSFGLETLAQSGRVATAGHLAEYCRTTLHASWAPCDALLSVAAYELRGDDLWQLDAHAHASRAAQETRDAHAKMGRRLRELGRALHPDLPWREWDEARDVVGTHAIVYGWLCVHLEISRDEAARGYLYATLNATLNNAVRLLRVGQTTTQTLLRQLAPEIDAAWKVVRERSSWEFATSAPELDVAQMEHETLYSRLFMS